MHVVYKGKQPLKSVRVAELKDTTFDRGVPTFVPLSIRNNILDDPDFEEWDKAKNYNGVPRWVHVSMPDQLDWFLASRAVIARCRYMFPLNPIRVRCRSEYAHLVDATEVSQGSELGEKYYRSYELRPSHNKWLATDRFVRKFSLEQICLMMSKLYQTELGDAELAPHFLDRNTERSGVVLVRAGDSIAKTSDAFASAALEAVGRATVIERFDPEHLREQLDAIDKARFFIACGETVLSYYAAYTKVQGLAVVTMDNRQLYTEKGVTNQLTRLGMRGMYLHLLSANMGKALAAVKSIVEGRIEDSTSGSERRSAAPRRIARKAGAVPVRSEPES